MKSPYLSRVRIKNFRNFKDVDVNLTHKQVIIGENNVGKTNFLRAIQLILDREFTDTDRQLDESDFHDSLNSPMIAGEEIEILIEIRGYEHNRKLVAQFEDAIVATEPFTLRFAYKFFPQKDENGEILNYTYRIFKGLTEDKSFTSIDRSYINIRVIKALRDVERELFSNRKSPLYQLVKLYEIQDDELSDISEALKTAANEILELDEIKDIKNSLQNKFDTLSGIHKDKNISLRTFEIDPERLLYSLQVYLGIKERPISELSLGLANILYLTIILLLLKDRTVPSILKKELFTKLASINSDLLEQSFVSTEKGNYILKEDLSSEAKTTLYAFFDQNTFKTPSFTILAIEEPEAHLHPILQRLIYKEILQKSNTSVIFTSHSPYISSVAPIETVVHCINKQGSTKVYSSASLTISELEKKDLERYLDAKRGEIYFGKGVIFIEGITEEFLIPKAAELLGMPLDDYGIVVCNINSTNFKPYIQLVNSIGIPWVLITDGDFYKVKTVIKKGKDTEVKEYHTFKDDTDPCYFLGHEIIQKILIETGLISTAQIPEESKKNEFFNSFGCFVGKYTLEVDLMEKGATEGNDILKKVYNEIKPKGQTQFRNFEKIIDSGDYWKTLKKIEDTTGKGRFAQRLSSYLISNQIPGYITSAINYIIEKTKSL